jgi:sRNA-binding carbon storage regulator CsrA
MSDTTKLTLGRRIGECITLTVPPSQEPTIIEVELGRITGNQAKIITFAKPTVKIVRSELL